MADGFYERQLDNANHLVAGGFSGVDNGMERLSGVLNDTMRNFSDQLHFQLQSLNLTLSTLNSGIYNLSSKIGNLTPNVAGQYIPSGIHPGEFLGNLSREYVNAQGRFGGLSSLLMGDSAFINRPYNVSGLEYYTGARMQQDLFPAKFAGNIAHSLLTSLIPTDTLSTMFGDAFFTGTEAYMNNADMIRRMSGRFGGPMQLPGAMSAARGLQRLSYREAMQTSTMASRLGFQGYTDIAALGLQGDLFHGNSPDELVKQVKDAGKAVKVISSILGSKDVKEAMDAIVQLKNMGVNVAKAGGVDFMRQLESNSYGLGFLNSMTSGQMLNAGMQIAQAGFGTNGIPGALGVQQGMQNLAYVSELKKRGILTTVDIAAGGGDQSIAAKTLSLSGNLLNSGMGRAWFSAGYGPGGFSANAATGAYRGGFAGMIGQGIRNMVNGNFAFNYADQMLNRNNYLAGAMQENPMAAEEMVRAHIKEILSYLQQMNILSGDPQKDQTILAMFLVNNYGMSEEAAKTEAHKYYNQYLSRQLRMRSEVSIQQADLDKQRIRNSTGSLFRKSIVDPIGRGIASMKQPFVEAGEWISEKFSLNPRYTDEGAMFNAIEKDYFYDEVDNKGKKTGVKKLNKAKAIAAMRELYGKDNIIDSDIYNSVGGLLGLASGSNINYGGKAGQFVAGVGQAATFMSSNRNYQIVQDLQTYGLRHSNKKYYDFLQKGEGLASNTDINDVFSDLVTQTGKSLEVNLLNDSEFKNILDKQDRVTDIGGKYVSDIAIEFAKKNRSTVQTLLSSYSNKMTKLSESDKDKVEKLLNNKNVGLHFDALNRGNDPRKALEMLRTQFSIAYNRSITDSELLRLLEASGNERAQSLVKNIKTDEDVYNGIRLAGFSNFRDAISKHKGLLGVIDFEDTKLNAGGALVSSLAAQYDENSKYNISKLSELGILNTTSANFLEFLDENISANSELESWELRSGNHGGLRKKDLFDNGNFVNKLVTDFTKKNKNVNRKELNKVIEVIKKEGISNYKELAEFIRRGNAKNVQLMAEAVFGKNSSAILDSIEGISSNQTLKDNLGLAGSKSSTALTDAALTLSYLEGTQLTTLSSDTQKDLQERSNKLFSRFGGNEKVVELLKNGNASEELRIAFQDFKKIVAKNVDEANTITQVGENKYKIAEGTPQSPIDTAVYKMGAFNTVYVTNVKDMFGYFEYNDIKDKALQNGIKDRNKIAGGIKGSNVNNKVDGFTLDDAINKNTK